MRSFLLIILLTAIGIRVNATNEHQWAFADSCMWVDDIITGIFTDEKPYVYNVAVDKDILNEGYYRINNPYGPSNPYFKFLKPYITADDNIHGIVINATDPDNVIIEPSYIGLNVSGEEIFVQSYSYMALIGEIPQEIVISNGYVGTLSEGIIRFPGKYAIWGTTKTLDASDDGYYCNPNGQFELHLPNTSSNISILQTESAEPSVYFNLQGIQIEYPRPGQIAIRRRGNKIDKIIGR